MPHIGVPKGNCRVLMVSMHVVHMYMQLHGDAWYLLPPSFSTIFIKNSSILLSLPLQCWDYGHMLAHGLLRMWVLRIQTQVLGLMGQKAY